MLSHHHTFSARTETNRNLRRRLLALVSAMSLTAFGAHGVESSRGAEATGCVHWTATAANPVSRHDAVAEVAACGGNDEDRHLAAADLRADGYLAAADALSRRTDGS